MNDPPPPPLFSLHAYAHGSGIVLVSELLLANMNDFRIALQRKQQRGRPRGRGRPRRGGAGGDDDGGWVYTLEFWCQNPGSCRAVPPCA